MKKRLLSILAILLVLALACGIYLGDFYHADTVRIEKFTFENEVEV